MSYFIIIHLSEAFPPLTCDRVLQLCPSPSQMSSPILPPQLLMCFTITVEAEQQSRMRRMVPYSLNLGWCHLDNFSIFSIFCWANTAITHSVLNDIQLPSQVYWAELKSYRTYQRCWRMEIELPSLSVVKYIWCNFHLLNFLVTVWSDEEIASKEATIRTSILKGKKQGKVPS